VVAAAKFPFSAPPFKARIAFGLKAPKLMPEMFSTEEL